MYINSIGHYVPTARVDNAYFEKVNGLSDEWIFTRTGIKTRAKAGEDEDNHTMGLRALDEAITKLSYSIKTVDLIIHASYSPLDTVATLAHVVQQKYNILKAKVFYLSSACSSFINAIEIAYTFFQSKKASRALIIASEHNTAYSHDYCEKSGHLWGDAAVAVFVSKKKESKNDARIIDVTTHGLGNIGKGPGGVYLQPGKAGLVMPDGQDVYQKACRYMVEALNEVLNENDFTMDELDYIIPHQANQRIVRNIQHQLNLEKTIFLGNIEEFGNTGCASTPLVLSQNWDILKKRDLVGITVFGGGYSSGAMLLER
jgi:3-oxoacyl-[acyl-carrier-protein] synthase-3